MGKPVKNSIAFVIYNENRSRILIVQRPDDDQDLPSVWGLPAGSLKADESFEQAVIRAGKEKLGIELGVGKLINEGTIEREKFILHMKEFEAKIVAGQPSVPQPVPGITQYQQLRWGTPEDCIPAAQKGSLCSRLLLGSLGRQWN